MSVQQSMQIYLDSKQANLYKYGTSSVTFNFQMAEIPDDYHIHASINSACIPVSFYNVNWRNNVLKYSISGIIYTVIIPVGDYSVTQLTNTLNTLMSGAGFTITYNSQ